MILLLFIRVIKYPDEPSSFRRQFLSVHGLHALLADRTKGVTKAGSQVQRPHAKDLKIPFLIQGGAGQIQFASRTIDCDHQDLVEVDLRHLAFDLPEVPDFRQTLRAGDDLWCILAKLFIGNRTAGNLADVQLFLLRPRCGVGQRTNQSSESNATQEAQHDTLLTKVQTSRGTRYTKSTFSGGRRSLTPNIGARRAKT